MTFCGKKVSTMTKKKGHAIPAIEFPPVPTMEFPPAPNIEQETEKYVCKLTAFIFHPTTYIRMAVYLLIIIVGALLLEPHAQTFAIAVTGSIALVVLLAHTEYLWKTTYPEPAKVRTTFLTLVYTSMASKLIWNELPMMLIMVAFIIIIGTLLTTEARTTERYIKGFKTWPILTAVGLGSLLSIFIVP